MNSIPGVILAGGLSRRMGGGDKGLLDLGGRSILDHVIARIGPQVGALAINANGDPTRFAAHELPVIADTIDGFAGPLAGVLAGLNWAADLGATSIVTVAADTPFFPRDLVVRLQVAADVAKAGIALAATPDARRGQVRHPTFGLWPIDLRDDLQRALDAGLRKVVIWTDQHDAVDAVFDASDSAPFFNVNTPEDLTRARAILSEGGT